MNLQIPDSAPSFLRNFAREVRTVFLSLTARIGALESSTKRTERLVRLVPTDYAYAWQTLTIAANTTMGLGDLNRCLYINCTSASEYSLCEARHGGWVMIVNGGSAALTIKDGSTTLCTLGTDVMCFIRCFTDSSFVPEWPDRVATYGADGTFTPGLDPGYMTHPQVLARTMGS